MEGDIIPWLKSEEERLFLPLTVEEVHILLDNRAPGLYLGPFEGCFGVEVVAIRRLGMVERIPGASSHSLAGEEVILWPSPVKPQLLVAGWNRVWFTEDMF